MALSTFYLSLPSILGILCASVVISFAAVLVRRIWFHPLSKYPGPILGKVSDFVTFHAVFKKSRTFVHYDLLKRYGSPVRIGTNHLVFGDIGSCSDIYGQSSNPCPKDGKVYDGLSVTGVVNILSATERHVHSRLRRLVAHSFSARALLESVPMMQAKIEEFLEVSLQNKEAESKDILPHIHELYLDIVSQLSFGKSFDCLTGKNTDAREDVAAFFTVIPAIAFAPFIRYLPIKSVQNGLQGVSRLEWFSRTCVLSYLSASTGKEKIGQEQKFLHHLATAADPETGSKLTETELVENSIIFLTAGSGTTSATLLYLIWECGQNEVIRRRLISEIRDAFPDPSIKPTLEKASKLEYLRNVLEETLRLWGPLSVSNTRVSPGKSINGAWIPKGVTVETCAYSTARDPNTFPDPLKFDPSRWENATPQMKAMSRPFSSGPRNCVGRHLAEMVLTLTVSRMYQLYDIVPHDSITAEMMAQKDNGVLEPSCSQFRVVATARPSF